MKKPFGSRMNAPRWELMLSRWSEVPDCGEKRLLCRLISMVIAEEAADDLKPEDLRFKSGYFRADWLFDHHLMALGIDPQFVRDQIERAEQWEVAA